MWGRVPTAISLILNKMQNFLPHIIPATVYGIVAIVSSTHPKTFPEPL